MSVVSGEVSPRLDASAYDRHSEETRDGDEERREDRCDGSSWVQRATADELAVVMEAAFGRSDARLCRAVDAVRSYATPLRYVAPLFAAAAEQPASLPALRRCAFDLSAACRLDPSGAGVQFLTLDAVRVSQAALTPR